MTPTPYGGVRNIGTVDHASTNAGGRAICCRSQRPVQCCPCSLTDFEHHIAGVSQCFHSRSKTSSSLFTLVKRCRNVPLLNAFWAMSREASGEGREPLLADKTVRSDSTSHMFAQQCPQSSRRRHNQMSRVGILTLMRLSSHTSCHNEVRPATGSDSFYCYVSTEVSLHHGSTIGNES